MVFELSGGQEIGREADKAGVLDGSLSMPHTAWRLGTNKKGHLAVC